MHLRTLEPDDVVLRAVTRARHIDRETRCVDAGAFMLRTFEGGRKEEALSVSYDCLVEVCAASFKKCYGVASLQVGGIRGIPQRSLDVVSDSPNHANITGLPHPDDDEALAEFIASRLRDQAQLVWQP